MKTLLVVLVLAGVFRLGEALRCNRCINRSCSTVETCTNPSDICAYVRFLPPAPQYYFRRCMKQSDCYILDSQPTIMSVTCCTTDRCN
ncbi:hypothetical protein CRUP_002735 [Coryphaenoides rupestris]|nr:hypothetical protein CRUP_002735 [Coryphaenoides rupestris]